MNTTSTTKKTAIVIGATGLIGAELVDLLVLEEQVEKVITITRRPVDYASEKIENHVIDFADMTKSAHLFKGEWLFSCLGTTARVAGSIEAQRIVDLDYQLAAAELAIEQGVQRYFLVSSSGANAKSFSAYLKMKGELEAKVSALAFKQITIFQPSLLLGEREQSRLAEDLASKVMPTLCKLPGLRRYRPIKGSEVAQKMVSEATKPVEQKIKTITLDEVFPT